MLCVVAIFVAALAGVGLSGADPWPFDITKLSAPDGSITVKCVSLGATLVELFVKDRFGNARDVILGYDNNTLLLTDPAHPVFNAIVGRYANRIKNGTFSIPITKYPQPPGPNVYHLPLNDFSEQATLHGGTIGWDRRNWTIVEKTPTKVTYRHFDAADEGFPGNVTAYATHEVHNGGVLRTTIRATATQKTPIMLTQHFYWNLDAFRNGSDNILEHRLRIDGSRVIVVDGDMVPTGQLLDVRKTPYDFRQEHEIGFYRNKFSGNCASGCQGYDTAWIYDDHDDVRSATSLWSNVSGIRLDISSNQPAVQIYVPPMINIPRKAIHGGPDVDYGLWPAVAIEQEGYLDAINTPEWDVDQIYYPGKEYEWSTTYRFSITL